jgi:hypothetical protein
MRSPVLEDSRRILERMKDEFLKLGSVPPLLKWDIEPRIYPIETPWSNDGERDYWRAWERVRGDYLRSLPRYVSHHVQEIDS